MKSILVCDLFYMVALDTAGPLLETNIGNRYVLITIDHYANKNEARFIKDHDVATATKFPRV
jgi:hypothetical protein